MTRIRVGLVGASGWMGRTHALLLAAQHVVFGPEPSVSLEMVADATPELAADAARACGVARSTGDWRELVASPDVDVVDVVTPNHLHHTIALAAIAAGKHVYCEKPLAMNSRQSFAMAQAAGRRGVVTLVGYNYPVNPIHRVAREIIAAGDIGEVVNVRFSKNVDYMSDPQAPFVWRHDRSIAGSGTLGDTVSHLLSMLQYLIGDVAEVMGHVRIVHGERPLVPGAAIGRQAGPATALRKVETDDEVLVLLKLAGGATGTMDASRVATGRRMEFAYVVTGTRGSLAWSIDRLNTLEFYSAADRPGRQGFRRIEAAPEHAGYGAFYPVANIGMGYNDQKMIEIRTLIEAVAAGRTDAWPNFADAHRIQCTLDAIAASSLERRWVRVSEIAERCETTSSPVGAEGSAS